MSKLKIVATDGLDKEASEKIKHNPHCELTVHKAVPATELDVALKGADIVIIRSATKLTEDVLAKASHLKGVIRAGVGIDNIDLKAAEAHGIWVWNAPTGNFQATAELALGLLFAAARRIAFATEGARRGEWLKSEVAQGARQLSGSTLGIYGAGNIGLRVARMAAGIGMKVQICDPVYKGGPEFPFEPVSFDALLTTSDFITIHAPMLDSTRHAFNREAFAKMKPGMILVNAARGGIIRDADISEALESGQLGAVALDVFEKEPVPPTDAMYQKLLKHPRVVATPHVGASTVESQRLVGLECAEKIERVANAARGQGKAPRPLNLPKHPRLHVSVDG